jgi:hypothetical protein
MVTVGGQVTSGQIYLAYATQPASPAALWWPAVAYPGQCRGDFSLLRASGLFIAFTEEVRLGQVYFSADVQDHASDSESESHKAAYGSRFFLWGPSHGTT